MSIGPSRAALITGVTGQDGAYLAARLLERGYRVVGCYRRTASTNFWRLQELGVQSHPDLTLVNHDLTDLGGTVRLLEATAVSEVFNLAAQSYVGVSFEQPSTTAQITGIGALNMLEAVRIVDPSIRFYQASTSEMFGKVQEVPQSESTCFYPRSPYGVAKLFAHWTTINYRESYGLFATSGILFNHESPLRGLEFVTRKITDGVARLALGASGPHFGSSDSVASWSLELGNLNAKRDWGYAGDYVEGMWRMLQIEQPDTYVLSTGRAVTVREFVRMAFDSVGVAVSFRGEGSDEVGIVDDVRDCSLLAAHHRHRAAVAPGQAVVVVNAKYYRPAEVDVLIGDCSKAKRDLGWEPQMSLEDLCKSMVEADLRRNGSGYSF